MSHRHILIQCKRTVRDHSDTTNRESSKHDPRHAIVDLRSIHRMEPVGLHMHARPCRSGLPNWHHTNPRCLIPHIAGCRRMAEFHSESSFARGVDNHSMADGASTQTRVLISGAAGRIGTAFVAEYGHRYRFRLADKPGAVMDAPGPHEVIAFDIADLRAFRAACDGIDLVVHLAADPSPEADFYGSLLNNNILGAFNAFRAAKDAGCRRLIFASSVHAVM